MLRSALRMLDSALDSEITSDAMQRLLGIGNVALNDLAKRGIWARASSSAWTSRA